MENIIIIDSISHDHYQKVKTLPIDKHFAENPDESGFFAILYSNKLLPINVSSYIKWNSMYVLNVKSDLCEQNIKQEANKNM